MISLEGRSLNCRVAANGVDFQAFQVFTAAYSLCNLKRYGLCSYPFCRSGWRRSLG